MPDQNEQSQTEAINKIADSLSLLLGGSYAPDSLNRDSTAKSRNDRTYHRLAAVEARRQRNIEDIIQAAYSALDSEHPRGGERDLDADWLARFIDFAQDVGNADMHAVWGYILMRESQTPGCASLPVLEALSRMVPADLDLWEKAGRIAFPTGYLIKLGGRNEFEDFGITESDLQRLKTLWLVQESEDLSVTFYAPTKGITFDFKGADLIVRHPTSQLFTLPAFRLTGVGIAMLPLLADVPVDMEYIEALGQDLKSQGYDFRVRDGDGALIEYV